MNTISNEPVFINKRFDVCEGVYFTIDIAYIQGHPIAKTKTLQLYYRNDRA